MYRRCICIGVLILVNLPLWSQQDSGDSVPSPGETFQDCDECPKMVVVPSGIFRMGAPARERGSHNKRPLHRVRIDYQFAVGVYEVTFDEWYACVDAGGCESYIPGIPDNSWDRENRPVINVSWDDAQSYVRWLSAWTGKTYRLLSESEWEYVARAGTETAYSWGDSVGVNRANCNSCGSQWDDEKTAPVGSFAANAWGVYDMHGNVYEWVQDCWNFGYEGAPADGSACCLETATGACFVVVRGAPIYGPYVRRIATGSPPMTGNSPAASVFELPGIFSSYELSKDDYMDEKQAKEMFRRML